MAVGNSSESISLSRKDDVARVREKQQADANRASKEAMKSKKKLEALRAAKKAEGRANEAARRERQIAQKREDKAHVERLRSNCAAMASEDTPASPQMRQGWQWPSWPWRR